MPTPEVCPICDTPCLHCSCPKCGAHCEPGTIFDGPEVTEVPDVPELPQPTEPE